MRLVLLSVADAVTLTNNCQGQVQEVCNCFSSLRPRHWPCPFGQARLHTLCPRKTLASPVTGVHVLKSSSFHSITLAFLLHIRETGSPEPCHPLLLFILEQALLGTTHCQSTAVQHIKLLLQPLQVLLPQRKQLCCRCPLPALLPSAPLPAISLYVLWKNFQKYPEKPDWEPLLDSCP